MPPLSLAHLTVLDLLPPEVISVVAETGCAHVASLAAEQGRPVATAAQARAMLGLPVSP